MPVAAGPQQAYQSHFPSFSTVFGLEPNRMESRSATIDATNENLAAYGVVRTSGSPTEENEDSTSNFMLQHQHRGSTSTQASESTDSSPTTTISTIDSSSMTDPSPASSPESPITIIPLSSFTASPQFALSSLNDLSLSEKPPLERPSPASRPLERPVTSPSPRRFRNQKGLALNLPSHSGNSSPEQILEDSNSIPASPSAGFVIPPKMKARKKPSLLSLQTSGPPNALGRLAFEPPPTPGGSTLHNNASLRHVQSVPQLFSPSAAPVGGMQLPGFRSRPVGLSKLSFQDTNVPIAEERDDQQFPISQQMASRPSEENIGGDKFEGDETDQAGHENDYPDGPACIFEPSVFLYKEPTAEEASKFDVVINVASEIRNPFLPKSAETDHEPLPAPRTTFGFDEPDRDDIPEPSTAMSTATFHSALEWPSESQRTPTQSPTTPRPASNRPEYIHLPWEHSTDNVKDLLRMVEVMDSKVKSGKTILVHCAQGISRSASLIIAYGIFLNPSLTPDQAHDMVKLKSPWISPNMRLVYQIQDFKRELLKKRSTGNSRIKHSGRSPTKHRNTLSADGMELSSKEALTAPLDGAFDKDNTMILPTGNASRPRGHSTPNFGDITPGPSSAPSSYAWPRSQEQAPTFDLQPVSTNDFLPKSQNTNSSSSSVTPVMPEQRTSASDTLSESDVNSQTASTSSKKAKVPLTGLNSTTASTAGSNPFADFDFGFGPGSQPASVHEPETYENKQTQLSLALNVSQEPASRFDKFKIPPIPGSFPSPGLDSPGFGGSSTGFSLFPGFGSHRKSLRSAPSLPSLSSTSRTQGAALSGFRSFENETPQFAAQAGESNPLSPALFSPRVQETADPISTIFAEPFVRPARPTTQPKRDLTPLSPALFSPRVQEFVAMPVTDAFAASTQPPIAPPARLPPPPPSEQEDWDMDGMMSPRATEFTVHPFAGPTFNNAQDAAASFGFATTTSVVPLPTVVDPRSPPTKGEAPIIRSIDDVL